MRETGPPEPAESPGENKESGHSLEAAPRGEVFLEGWGLRRGPGMLPLGNNTFPVSKG